MGAVTLAGAPVMARVTRARRTSIREDHVGAAATLVPAVPRPPGQRVPQLLETSADLALAPIDHRAGFLLAHVDGATSIEGLVDISGMPEPEVLEIVERLRRLGIVSLR